MKRSSKWLIFSNVIIIVNLYSGSSIEELSWITWDKILNEAGVNRSMPGVSE